MALLLSGCITASKTLSPDQVALFRLPSVEVTVAPNAQIWWPDADKDPSARQVAGSAGPEQGSAQARSLLAAMIREVGFPNGAIPGRAGPRVPGHPGLMRLLLGGDHMIRADVDLLDAKTGALLLAFPAEQALIQGGHGPLGVALDNVFLDEPADRAVRYYVIQYRNWLLRK